VHDAGSASAERPRESNQAHALGTVGRPSDRKVISAIVAAQAQAQPLMQWLTERIVPREIDRNEALKCQTSSSNLVY
jgi:hypothetical protein